MAKDAGLVNGYDSIHFGPDDLLTRAQAAKLFAEIYYPHSIEEVRSPLSDINSTQWFYPYVSVLIQKGVIHGYDNGTFGPDDAVTLAQFAAMAARSMDNLSEDYSSYALERFSDLSAGYWANSYIGYMAYKGIIRGYPDGTVRPDEALTRKRATTLFIRLYEMMLSTKQAGIYIASDGESLYRNRWVRLDNSTPCSLSRDDFSHCLPCG